MFTRDLKARKYLKKATIVYIPPMEYTFMKVFLSRFYRKKVITDVYAPHYDMTVNDEKIYTKKSIVARFYHWQDRYIIKKSTVSLFLNEPEKEYFLKQVNIKKYNNRMEVLPLYIPLKPQAEIRYFKKEREIINLCWTGTFINLQGVDKIIDAAYELKKMNFRCKIYIIGPDKAAKQKWIKYVDEKGISDYVIFPNVWGDFQKWENFIVKNCDITLGIFGDSQKAKTVVANKVIDGIAFKTPLITAESIGIDFYFKNNEIYVTKNDPISIANKIIEVSNLNLDVIKKNIENAYTIYEMNFSKEVFKKKFANIVDSCLKN